MSVSAGARVQRRTSGLSDKARKRIEITILSLPALIMFLGFVILPVFMAGYYGFFKWKGYGKPTVNGQFIGFENYKIILTDPNFQQALGHTLFVVVASLVIQGPLAILFALLLNQRFKGRALIRTLIFVPYVVSEVIVGTGWGPHPPDHRRIECATQENRTWRGGLDLRSENRHLDIDVHHFVEVHRLRRHPDDCRHAVDSRRPL